jgi:hypothetical protein
LHERLEGARAGGLQRASSTSGQDALQLALCRVGVHLLIGQLLAHEVQLLHDGVEQGFRLGRVATLLASSVTMAR